jgi:hypothetical protein
VTGVPLIIAMETQLICDDFFFTRNESARDDQREELGMGRARSTNCSDRQDGRVRAKRNRLDYECADWSQLPQDRVQWQALVSAVMNLWIPYKAENLLTS